MEMILIFSHICYFADNGYLISKAGKTFQDGVFIMSAKY